MSINVKQNQWKESGAPNPKVSGAFLPSGNTFSKMPNGEWKQVGWAHDVALSMRFVPTSPGLSSTGTVSRTGYHAASVAKVYNLSNGIRTLTNTYNLVAKYTAALIVAFTFPISGTGETILEFEGPINHPNVAEAQKTASYLHVLQVTENLVSLDFISDTLWNLRTYPRSGSNKLQFLPLNLPPSITNLTSALNGYPNFNQRLDWNFKNVTNMSAFLMGAASYNSPVSHWNMSNVTSMINMFNGAVAFNQPLQGWNVEKVTSMRGMFKGAASFNQSFYGLITRSLTDTAAMFQDATSFNGIVETLIMSKVTNASNMFSGALAFNRPIRDWQMTSLQNASYMFHKAASFNQQPGKLVSASTTNVSYMFSEATSFNQHLWDFRTPNVTTFEGMFKGASKFISGTVTFSYLSATTTASMFEDAVKFNQYFAFDAPNLKNTSAMFKGASLFNGQVNFNTGAVENMDEMFMNCTAFNQILPVKTFDGVYDQWNTVNVLTMRRMFQGTTVFNQNISGWNVTKVTDWTNFRTGSALSTANTPEKFR